MMENLLDDQPVSGLVPHDLEAQLHLACDDGEPWSFAEAERHAAWRAVMQSEMDAVENNRTWELADLPRGHNAITLKWVFKLKRDEAGAIIKHKARLEARSFVQRDGIGFDDTFILVARMESVWLLFALATQEGWRVHHMDAKSTFLNDDFDGNKSLYLVYVGVVFFSASWTAFRTVRTSSWTAFRAVRTAASWLFC
jgi:hypothetical protein